MHPESIVMVRFDYILGENTADAIEQLTDGFGGFSLSAMASSGIRDDQRINRIYFTDTPDTIGFRDFEYYSVQLSESTGGVTEVISMGKIEEEKVQNIVERHDIGSRAGYYAEWLGKMESIREYIPESKSGAESTIFWVSPNKIPEPIKDLPMTDMDIFMSFREGPGFDFLLDFPVVGSSSAIRFGRETILFPNDLSKPCGRLVAVDRINKIKVTSSKRGHKIPKEFEFLSSLYAAHYWCVKRGSELDSINADIDKSKLEFPSALDENVDVLEHLDFDNKISELQEKWGPFYSNVSSQQSELVGKIDELDFDYVESNTSAANEGVLSGYMDSIEKELNDLRFDLERIDKSITSISVYFENQLSISSSRKNIQLQNKIHSQMEATNDLQDSVQSLSWIIVLLTLVLVIDTVLPGGVPSILSETTTLLQDLSKVQWLGIVFVTILSISAILAILDS